jgi:hypothetical protein
MQVGPLQISELHTHVKLAMEVEVFGLLQHRRKWRDRRQRV